MRATTIESARLILDRAKDALNLPDTRYPKERLAGTDCTVAASLAGVAGRERATGGLRKEDRMIFALDYASPSVFESDRERALLGMSANARRPVRFHGQCHAEYSTLFRFTLRALGEAIWSNDTWVSQGELMSWILDPVITVHPDRIFLRGVQPGPECLRDGDCQSRNVRDGRRDRHRHDQRGFHRVACGAR